MVALIATKIELALGANLTGNPASWTWTDLSTRGLGSVTVRAGRMDEASLTQPTQCTFRLTNTDGALTPRFPASPYYPNVRRQTPVRVSLNPGTGYQQRFQGYIDSITPSWPSGNSTVAEVTVVASGLTRRLSQGSAKLHSALYRAVTTASILPDAYWPLEDGNSVTQSFSAVNNGPPMVAIGASDFGSTTGAPGSDIQPSFSAGGSLKGAVPGSGSPTSWRVQCLVKANTVSGASFAVPLDWQTADGNSWELDINAAGSGGLVYSDTLTHTISTNARVDDGQWHEIRCTASQSGGNIVIAVFVDGSNVGGTTFAGTVSRITNVIANVDASASNIITGVGHYMVWNGNTTISGLDTILAMNGNAGETPTARMTRLCSENSIQLGIAGTSSDPMGPQRVDTLNNLLRECEAVDGGILYDGAGAGFSYLARSSRYNQAVSLALDCNRYQVKLPFAPVEDDQRVRNDWTITRPNGSPVPGHFADAAHIAANGLYNASATLNVQTDSQTLNQAAWRVHLGTAEEMRLPNLTFDPLHSPELQTQWFATTLGGRLTAANLPTQYPNTSTDQIIEGWTETWDSVTWSVTPNLSPYAPWNVDALDTNFPLELDGQTLASNLTPGALTLSLAAAAGKPLLTTSAGDFPIDLNVGGWQVHATAASGSSSPQTVTITASPNTVTVPSGTAVTLWQSPVLAL